jgi:hypothetical protein
MFEMFDNCGAKNRLSASRDAMEPQEGMLVFLPLLKMIALQEPQSCIFCCSLLMDLVLITNDGFLLVPE